MTAGEFEGIRQAYEAAKNKLDSVKHQRIFGANKEDVQDYQNAHKDFARVEEQYKQAKKQYAEQRYRANLAAYPAITKARDVMEAHQGALHAAKLDLAELQGEWQGQSKIVTDLREAIQNPVPSKENFEKELEYDKQRDKLLKLYKEIETAKAKVDAAALAEREAAQAVKSAYYQYTDKFAAKAEKALQEVLDCFKEMHQAAAVTSLTVNGKVHIMNPADTSRQNKIQGMLKDFQYFSERKKAALK
jgi:hypothetical protein